MVLQRRAPRATRLDRMYFAPQLGREDLRSLYVALSDGADSCTFTADGLEGENLSDLDALDAPTIREFNAFRFTRRNHIALHIRPLFLSLSASRLADDVLVIERQVDAVMKDKSKTRFAGTLLAAPQLVLYAFVGVAALTLGWMAKAAAESLGSTDGMRVLWIVVLLTAVFGGIMLARRPTRPPIVLTPDARPWWRRNVEALTLMATVIGVIVAIAIPVIQG